RSPDAEGLGIRPRLQGHRRASEQGRSRLPRDRRGGQGERELVPVPPTQREAHLRAPLPQGGLAAGARDGALALLQELEPAARRISRDAPSLRREREPLDPARWRTV